MPDTHCHTNPVGHADLLATTLKRPSASQLGMPSADWAAIFIRDAAERAEGRVSPMSFYSVRLAWAPVSIALASSLVLGILSLFTRSADARGGLWFLIGALLVGGFGRTFLWISFLGKVEVNVDLASSDVLVIKGQREVGRMKRRDLQKIEAEIGSERPELSRSAEFPRIVLLGKSGSRVSRKVLMRSSELYVDAKRLAAMLDRPGPGD